VVALLTLASHYERTGQTARMLKLAKYSEELLLYYLNQVPCIFAYRLADTESNRKRGIVGQNSGFRQGVRNPNFIPSGKQAKRKGNTTRYYDLGREAWRSWRRGNVISVTAFWSVELEKFVDTPEEAGIVRGKEFDAKPKREPKTNPAREAATPNGRRPSETEKYNARTNARRRNEDAYFIRSGSSAHGVAAEC